MSTIRYCVGGPWERICTQFGQHGDDCPDAAKTPDQPRTCRGCYPRLATQGHLCDTCDTYLRQWLDVTSHTPRTPDGKPATRSHVPDCKRADCPGCEWRTGSVLWVHWWLGLAQSARITRAPRWDTGRGEKDDLPSPLSEAILDCRSLLVDRVYIAEERLRGRAGEFQRGVEHLARSVLRIEDDPDLCHHVYERLQDSVTTAHRLAPWRAQAERLQGIACPHCERMSLVIEGGEDFATCRSCRCTVVSRRFDQWVAMLTEGA